MRSVRRIKATYIYIDLNYYYLRLTMCRFRPCCYELLATAIRYSLSTSHTTCLPSSSFSLDGFALLVSAYIASMVLLNSSTNKFDFTPCVHDFRMNLWYKLWTNFSQFLCLRKIDSSSSQLQFVLICCFLFFISFFRSLLFSRLYLCGGWLVVLLLIKFVFKELLRDPKKKNLLFCSQMAMEFCFILPIYFGNLIRFDRTVLIERPQSKQMQKKLNSMNEKAPKWNINLTTSERFKENKHEKK